MSVAPPATRFVGLSLVGAGGLYRAYGIHKVHLIEIVE